MKIVNIWVDGATLGKNGKLGTVKTVGLGVFCAEPRIKISEVVSGGSSNEAEFFALLRGMEEAIRLGLRDVHFFSDSKIVVNRASRPRKKNGKPYRRPRGKNKNERMDAYQDEVLELCKSFDSVKFTWIPREENMRADLLSKESLTAVKLG